MLARRSEPTCGTESGCLAPSSRYYRSSRAPPPARPCARPPVDRERFDVALSLHASGLWPGREVRIWDEFHRLGTVMSQAQGAHAYKVRQLSRWGFFFRAHGAEIDHIYGKYGTKAFLVELTRSGLHPLKPSLLKVPFRWYNPERPERHVDKGWAAIRALVHTLSDEGR